MLGPAPRPGGADEMERRHIEPQHGDPRDTSADTRLARRDLGYEPRTTLERGLSRQWEWQRNT